MKKINIINSMIDLAIFSLLLINLSWGGVYTQNLCKLIPIFLWICFIMHLFTDVVLTAARVTDNKELKSQILTSKEMIQYIRKFPDKDSKIKKTYNFITDFITIVLFALNGFLGCVVLFILNNFFVGLCKSEIRELKKGIILNE